MSTAIEKSLRLLVVGGSTRAAVHSLIRAGYETLYAADYFGDDDLTGCCHWHRLGHDDPPNLVTVDATGKPVALADTKMPADINAAIYVGGMENRQELLGYLQSATQLFGMTTECVSKVRDPFTLFPSLQRDGIIVPACYARRPERLGGLLYKSFRSAGGLGVRWANGRGDALSGFWQQAISGVSYSGVYLATGHNVRLLSVSQQLVGYDHRAPREFQYAGSIGPLPPGGLQDQWLALGESLHRNFQLRGIFGVDAIVSDDPSPQVIPIEVNPRYPSSAEVWEYATRQSVMGQHVACWLRQDACEHVDFDPESMAGAAPSQRVYGRRILYAADELIVTSHIHRHWEEVLGKPVPAVQWPMWVDLPAVGTHVLPGHPLMTVLASGESVAQVAYRLQEKAERVIQD